MKLTLGAVPIKKTPALVIQKSMKLYDEEGILSSKGMSIAEGYARKWVDGIRDAETERAYPDLAGLFYDLRTDSDLAKRFAL